MQQITVEVVDAEEDQLQLTFRHAPSRDQLLRLLEQLRNVDGVRKVQHVLTSEPL